MFFLDSCISLVSPEKRTLFSKVLKGRVKKDLSRNLRGAVVDGRRLVTTVKEVARKRIIQYRRPSLVSYQCAVNLRHIDTINITLQ